MAVTGGEIRAALAFDFTFSFGDSAPIIEALEGGGWVVASSARYDASDSVHTGVFISAFDADGGVMGGVSAPNPPHTERNGFEVLYHDPGDLIAPLAGGGWVVTWNHANTKNGTTLSNHKVLQQAYNADGTKRGDLDVVSEVEGLDPFPYAGRQSVTGLADGGWVVTWFGGVPIGSEDNPDLYYSIYNADASLRDVQMLSVDQDWSHFDPVVAAFADGGWISAWETIHGTDEHDDRPGQIRFQAFDADGGRRGGVETVETTAGGDQGFVSVAVLADGGWVIGWVTDTKGADGKNFSDIYQQAYNADGTRRGGETRVNAEAIEADANPGRDERKTVTLPDGGWVVIWNDSRPDEPGDAVRQQIYNADGTPRGGVALVNDATQDRALLTDAAALPGGGWLVSYEGWRAAENVAHGFVQVFDADGNAYGDAAELGGFTSQDVRTSFAPTVAVLEDGDFVVSWVLLHYPADETVSNSYYIMQRRFTTDLPTTWEGSLPGDGDDTPPPGDGDGEETPPVADHDLGNGAQVLAGTAAELFGKTVANFGEDDTIRFADGVATLADLIIDGNTIRLATAGAGSPAITFAGDFSGGRFFLLPASDGGTELFFARNLVDDALVEGQAVPQAAINGAPHPAALTGDGARTFNVTLSEKATAALSNALGVYEIDAAGNIVDARILFADVKASPTATIAIDGVEAGHRLGFFIVNDGVSGDLSDIRFVNGAGAAANVSDGRNVDLVIGGAKIDAHVFHAFASSLNDDGLTHVRSGADPSGNGIRMAFEDLFEAGDSDFQDVVFKVGVLDGAGDFLI